MYKKIVAYTTRDMREGETQHKSYHFISLEDFSTKKELSFFAEFAGYDTIWGKQYYGTAKSDYSDDMVIIIGKSGSGKDTTVEKLLTLETDNECDVVIMNPIGLSQIKKNDAPGIVVYLKPSDKTISKYLLRRGDNATEVKRRAKADEIDFTGIEKYVDIIISCDGKAPGDIAKEIDKKISLRKNYLFKENAV